MVDWRSGITSSLGELGGGAAGSIPRSVAFVFLMGEMSVRPVYGLWCAHSVVWPHPVRQRTEGLKP